TESRAAAETGSIAEDAWSLQEVREPIHALRWALEERVERLPSFDGHCQLFLPADDFCGFFNEHGDREVCEAPAGDGRRTFDLAFLLLGQAQVEPVVFHRGCHFASVRQSSVQL